MNFKDKFNMTVDDNICLAKRNIIDSIWKSANLEGIAVTYPQTETIFNGLAVQNMKVKDINAIVNLKHAWEFVLDTVDYPVDLGYIERINLLIGDANVNLRPGEIRESDVSIGGTKWKPEIPDKEAIKEDISYIMDNEDMSSTEKAITMMLYLMRTQTFYDGNKRTASMVANQILIQNGAGIISIPVEEQENFRAELIDFYETGDMTDIKELVYNKCIDGILLRKNTTGPRR